MGASQRLEGDGFWSTILDGYSRCVLAWELSTTVDVRQFCEDTLARALATGRPTIFTTDQGSVHQRGVHGSVADDGRAARSARPVLHLLQSETTASDVGPSHARGGVRRGPGRVGAVSRGEEMTTTGYGNVESSHTTRPSHIPTAIIQGHAYETTLTYPARNTVLTTGSTLAHGCTGAQLVFLWCVLGPRARGSQFSLNYMASRLPRLRLAQFPRERPGVPLRRPQRGAIGPNKPARGVRGGRSP